MKTELYHHGIKGQKWGLRRFQNEDGSYTNAGKERYNENYSPEQRKHDYMVYGKGGVKRINRTMNNSGVGIQRARSLEANRLNSARKKASIAGDIAPAVVAVGGAVGGYFATKAFAKVMSNSSNQTMKTIAEVLKDPTANMLVNAAITTGAVSVGRNLGRSSGESIAMISSGYSPSKYK